MTKKEFGRCIAFCLVVCIVLIALCDLFELENNRNMDKRFTTFRNLNKDTVDAVWIGTSGVDRYWIPGKAYEEHGITLYTLSSDAMPTWLFINMIEEIYTYQNPQLIVVDMRAYGQSNTSASTMDVRTRRAMDAMAFLSPNRIKTAFTAMRVIHETIEGQPRFNLSLLLSYVKYHTMWKEEDYSIDDHWGNKEHDYLGYHMNVDQTPVRTKMEKVPRDKEIYEELDPLAKSSLYDLLEYAEANHIELLFVDTPQFKGEREMGRSAALVKLLEEEGVNYINYCETDREGNFVNCPGLSVEEDFYNEGHVNFYGAEKITDLLATYLEEHYEFPDRREDAAVQEQWDGNYAEIRQQVEAWTEESS